MNAEHAGWFVSEYPAGTLVCATERFAELATWVPVTGPAPDELAFAATTGISSWAHSY